MTKDDVHLEDRTEDRTQNRDQNRAQNRDQNRTESASKNATIPPAQSSARSSYVISLAILISRLLGLLREQVFAHYLGNSDAAGAFRAALRIPNFLQNLFGEGVLSASFIPVYSRLRAAGDDKTARAVAGTVASLLAVGVSLLVLFGVLLTPALVDIVAPGFTGDLKLLTVRLVQILFPGVGLLVFSAWCLGVLNSHRKFFLSYIAPVFWNAAMITALIGFGRTERSEDLVLKLAWASVIGSFLQFAVQVPFVFRYAGRIDFKLQRRPEVRTVFKNLGPVLISRGAVQLSAYIDGMIASFLGAAAVASLGYAQTLYLLPISLFGMAVAAAELPEMSAMAPQQTAFQTGGFSEAAKKLRERLSQARKRISFFVIPSVVAFVLLGQDIVALLFQTGRFGPEDTRYVWYILMGSVVGLLAATWGRLYSSAFYAQGDTRTPLIFAIVRVSLTVGLGLLFAFPLRSAFVTAFDYFLRLPQLENIHLSMGAVGLTSSAGLAGWVEFALLKRALDKKIGAAPLSASIMIKTWGSAVAAGLVSLALKAVINPNILGLDTQSRIASKVESALPILLFAVVYFALTTAFKVSELDRLLKRVFKRRSSS